MKSVAGNAAIRDRIIGKIEERSCALALRGRNPLQDGDISIPALPALANDPARAQAGVSAASYSPLGACAEVAAMPAYAASEGVGSVLRRVAP